VCFAWFCPVLRITRALSFSYNFTIAAEAIYRNDNQHAMGILGIKETYQVRLIFPQIPKPGSHIRHTNLKSIVQKSSL
jgi:hypothetical protein